MLIGGQELQVHRIQRDQGMIAQLIDLERVFWRHVESDQAPLAESADRASPSVPA